VFNSIVTTNIHVCWPQGVPVAPPALSLAVIKGNAATILACVQVWSVSVLLFFWLLLVYWPPALPTTCPFLCVSMYSYCLLNPRSFCKFQWYLAHWLNILSIAQPVMRLQYGAMFHIAWNLWGFIISKNSATLMTWHTKEQTCFAGHRQGSIFIQTQYTTTTDLRNPTEPNFSWQ